MQTERIAVTIEGVAPLLQNNGLSGAEGIKQRGRRMAGKGPDNPDEWQAKLYRVGGVLGHPTDAIWSALIRAAREFKGDKRRTMADPIRACVFPAGKFAVLVGKKEPDFIHEAMIVNPNTKGRGIRYRPAFQAGWRMEFDLDVSDPESVPVDKLKEILDYAGLRVGLGDWRPRYGRFMVTKFERVNGGARTS